MGRTGKIWCGSILMVTVVIFSQCSSYAGKSLLTFFFDGVPVVDSTMGVAPDTSELMADTLGPAMDSEEIPGPLLVVHYPYEERECATCHDMNSLGNMVESEPGLCYLCHDDLTTIYQYLHGPVAGGYCTSCHNPHQAESENLLRYTGSDLCFHCHNEARISRTEMHQDLGGMDCMECHNPHGGDDRFIFY